MLRMPRLVLVDCFRPLAPVGARDEVYVLPLSEQVIGIRQQRLNRRALLFVILPLGLAGQPVGRQLVYRSFYGRRRLARFISLRPQTARRYAHQHSNPGKERSVRSHITLQTKPGSLPILAVA